MYESISGLPDHVVLDANTLLNLLFIPDSHSRRAVRYLLDAGYKLLCSEKIQEEARQRIRNLELQHPSLGRLETELDLGLRQWPILFYPRIVIDQSLSKTPRHDRHVATIARRDSAWILTNDCRLKIGAERDNIPARFPVDVIHSHFDGRPPLNEVFRFHSLVLNSGSIFARVGPSEWAGSKGKGAFTVFDTTNHGRLFYDSEAHSWVYALDGSDIKLAADLTPRQLVCVAVNIHDGTVRLMASGMNMPAQGKRNRRLLGTPLGQIAYGHTLAHGDYWNGTFASFVMQDRPIKTNTFRCLTETRGGIPNPWDNDALEIALRQRLRAPPAIRII